MKGAYLVLASGERQQFVFMVKVGSKSNSKSKVKKADSVINLAIKQHQIVASAIVDDRSIMTMQGTSFSVSKHVSSLFEDQTILNKITINDAQTETTGVATQKQNNEDYNVVEMDQTRQINPQFQMFNLEEL